jgi:AraC-like DNA-binding protein
MRLGDLKQFSMFIIINVVYLPIYFKNETALSIYQQISRNNINNLVSSVYSIIVMFFVLRLLAGHSKRIKLNFSYLEKINLNWLKVITLLIIIFDILFVILLYIPQILDFDPSIPNTILILLSVLLIYITSIFGFRQPEIFKAYAHPVEPVKYKTSGLTEKKAIEIEKKLIEILSSKKPYLNEDLNINELADMLNITSAYLSQVINENLGFNFYNLINKYRIEEAKNLIESSRYASLKLETIAYDTGFKSKSTFNAAFKKFTNLTPSQFKMQIKNYPETES